MTNEETPEHSVVLTDEERAAVVARVEELGDVPVAYAVGVSRQTLARACAGFPVRRGSVELIRAAVAHWRA